MTDDRYEATEHGRVIAALPKQYRLAWRWKESGTTGRGPWMFRADVVEAWADSLNRRWVDRVEHWIEEGPQGEPVG